jgi:iron complex outermembrane receptor protein
LVTSKDGRVLDKALRDVNYNVRDGVVDANTVWLRSGIQYRFSDSWSLSNATHFYSSDRQYRNAEYFGFNPDTELVDRSTGIVTHDLAYWINRLTLHGDTRIGYLRNRLVVGGEYSVVDFFTERRFGSTTSVDPLDPNRGRFPTRDDEATFARRQNRDSRVATAAAFVQDALNLTDSWRLVGGLRYDRLDVDREELDLNADPQARTQVRRNFNALTWRVGTSYDLLPTTQVFAQYSTAASPPSSLLSLSREGAAFDMTTGRAVEAGVKSSPFGDRLVLGASAFYIEQDNIVTRSRNDPTVSVQGGKQSSRGAEVSLTAEPVPGLRFDGNYTILDARFDSLIDEQGNSLKGNTPLRVPEQVLNAFVYFDLQVVPITTSVGLHHAGRYFTDNANTIEVGAYTTLEAAIRYRLAVGTTTTDITLRARNLTNTLYAGYTDISPDQLTIAAPRSVDLLVTARL